MILVMVWNNLAMPAGPAYWRFLMTGEPGALGDATRRQSVTSFGFRHLGNEVIPGEYYEK